jgi:hypothetical protein
MAFGIVVPATGACKNVTLNMGSRGAWLDVVAIDADTRQQLSKLGITVPNSKHDRQGGSSNLPEAQPLLVPSHASFTVRVRAEGYRVSDPIHIEPLNPDEKKELTVPLRRQPTTGDKPQYPHRVIPLRRLPMSSHAKCFAGAFVILAFVGAANARNNPHVADADREYAAVFSHAENPCAKESTTLDYE